MRTATTRARDGGTGSSPAALSARIDTALRTTLVVVSIAASVLAGVLMLPGADAEVGPAAAGLGVVVSLAGLVVEGPTGRPLRVLVLIGLSVANGFWTVEWLAAIAAPPVAALVAVPVAATLMAAVMTAVALDQRLATDRRVRDESLRAARLARDDERRRWARDLHDDTLQQLAALRMVLQLGAHLPGGPLGDVALRLVDEQLLALRHLMAGLRPADLRELGLVGALEALGARSRAVFRVRVVVDCSDERAGVGAAGPPAEAEEVVYRVAQEAVNNAVRHAAASTVSVRFHRSRAHARLQVVDDGSGFDPARVHAGLGLAGMRERAGEVGGVLVVASTPGVGTSVDLSVPARRGRGGTAAV